MYLCSMAGWKEEKKNVKNFRLFLGGPPEHGPPTLGAVGRRQGPVQRRLIPPRLHLPLVLQARFPLTRAALLLAAEARQLHLLGAELLLLLGEGLHAQLHLLQHVDGGDLGLEKWVVFVF